MEKPLSLLVKDFKKTLVDSIQSSSLPPFIIEPILKEIYNEILIMANKQTEEDEIEYMKSIDES